MTLEAGSLWEHIEVDIHTHYDTITKTMAHDALKRNVVIISIGKTAKVRSKCFLIK